MPLKLMYITNRPDVALIAEQAGIDRVFLDMEYIGKDVRQKNINSVQNKHTVEDIRTIRKILTKAELLVRINPIHDATKEYCSSEDEIGAVIDAGADIIMLPYFKKIDEVKRFISCVNKKTKVLLLLETPEAVEIIDDIIQIPGIDEIHLGINDMSLGYGKKFMFQLLSDGTVEKICLKLRLAGIPYGFGGIASIGVGKLPPEAILKEHYRLGSSMVILSRSFCEINDNTKLSYIKEKFDVGIKCIRAFEKEISSHCTYFTENQKYIADCVEKIIGRTRQEKATNDIEFLYIGNKV